MQLKRMQILCKKNLSGISMILEELNHGSYVHVSATKKMEDFIVRKMEEKSLRFAILRQTDYGETKVTRTVVSSYPKELEGEEF